MVPAVVADSSVAFKWLQPEGEAGHEEALDLLEKHRAGEIVLTAPTLLRLEVANGYWRRRATAADLVLITRVLEGLSIRWVELSAALVEDAARIAAEHRLTVYDATFVALALLFDAELVTDDRAILRAGACKTRALAE
jgi:predicted nucleic acid-binding protein